jgi:signal transduction histidine kinase/ActR/RegA family two-component response regulator
VARLVLEQVHGLLSATQPQSIPEALQELASRFDVGCAGMAAFWEQEPICKHWAASAGEHLFTSPGWPWEEIPGLLRRDLTRAEKLPSTKPQHSLLAASCSWQGLNWLLWLEYHGERHWEEADLGVMALAAPAFARIATDVLGDNPWPRRLESRRHQQDLEKVALSMGRLVHDFNNVLTGVLGFTELSLGQVPSNSPTYQYLNGAYQAAQQGTQLLQQFSLFTKRNRGRSQSSALAPILRGEEMRLRPGLAPAVKLHIELPSGLPSLAVDPESLRLILVRLLDNAREAVEESGTITISAKTKELTPIECLDFFGKAEPGPCVEVTVADSGPGFTKEANARLFREPFFSSKPRHRGLGLMGVYGVLSACGGGLCIGETGETGAVVRVYLPVAAALPDRASAQRTAGNCCRGERLLVVDDDPLTLQLICTTLERAGYRVQPASDGAEALASFGKAPEPFHLVLSDVFMPQMTGFDLAQRLLAQNPRLNVLFTSGHIPADCLAAEPAIRNFDLLRKPFRPDGLLRAVRSALDRPPQGGLQPLVVPGTEKRP